MNEWDKIKTALENEKFRWRTIEGVAQETELPVDVVLSAVVENQAEVVKSAVPSQDGKPLFTTRRHYTQKASPISRMLSGLTNKVIP